MEIDFSPLEAVLDDLFIDLVTVLFLPLILALGIGFLLQLVKMPRPLLLPLVSLIYLYGVYKIFLGLE